MTGRSPVPAAASLTGVLILVLGLSAEAQVGGTLSPLTSSPAGSTYPPCIIPSDLNDPGFARHVDLLLLGTAWDNHDAALMTDVGLQLAEGERILMRPHLALKSEQILEFAAHLAGDRKDKPTLARLARAAEARKDPALVALVARQAAQAEAADGHPLPHAIEDISPASLEVHKSAIRRIRAARLAGNLRQLESIGKYFDEQKILHKSQRDHINNEITKAKDNLPTGSDFRALIGTLDRLAALTPCRD